MRLEPNERTIRTCPVCGKDAKDLLRAEAVAKDDLGEYTKWKAAMLAKSPVPKTNLLVMSMSLTDTPWGFEWCAHGVTVLGLYADGVPRYAGSDKPSDM